jgi:uncharacterized Zn-binding protein involved in type VI secretion
MPTGVNPPKTPVTKGSSGIAAATVPNICKMPGPPAPFVPTPLPNIGKSDNSPDGYSTTTTIEGDPAAIAGATFNSMGDVASQGTGGGLVSSNVEGPTTFVAPGSMDVAIEGKNVQQLGDAMTNNGGPSGTPANAATTPGEVQAPGTPAGPATKPPCTHPNLKRKEGSEPEKDAERRKGIESDIKKLTILANKNRAVGNLEAAEGNERGAFTKRFEQQVAAQTNAKEVSVQYYCPDCKEMNSEFDVITGDNVVKECTVTAKSADTKKKQLQFKKHLIAAAKLFPGSPVHMAVPAEEVAGVTSVDPVSVQGH